MAKLTAEAKSQLDRLSRGEQLQAGWCLDYDRDPAVFKCGEQEEAVAEGKISVSQNGALVTDLTTGETTTHKARRMAPAMAGVTVEGAPATGADTVTTDNAPAGGGRGGRP